MSEALYGFIGVIVGGIIPWFQSYINEKIKNNKDAEYLAVNVIVILENFIVICVDIVCDDGTHMGEPTGEGGTYSPQINLPKQIPFPKGLNWKSISASLMFKLLNLPNQLHEANRSIIFASENAFPPDYGELFIERQKQYAKLGLHALSIDTELRKTFSLPAKEYESNWKPREIFEKRLKEIEEIERKNNSFLMDRQ